MTPGLGNRCSILLSYGRNTDTTGDSTTRNATCLHSAKQENDVFEPGTRFTVGQPVDRKLKTSGKGSDGLGDLMSRWAGLAGSARPAAILPLNCVA